MIYRLPRFDYYWFYLFIHHYHCEYNPLISIYKTRGLHTFHKHVNNSVEKLFSSKSTSHSDQSSYHETADCGQSFDLPVTVTEAKYY